MKTKLVNGIDAYRIAAKYYGDSGCCAVVAVAVAARVSYGKAHHALAAQGRKLHQGTPHWMSDCAVHALRPDAGIIEHAYGDLGQRFIGATIGAFERDGPRTGTYMVTMRTGSRSSHIATMRDGVLEDWTAKAVRGKARRFTITRIQEVQFIA